MRKSNIEFVTAIKQVSMDKAQELLWSGVWSQRMYDRYSRFWVFSVNRHTGFQEAQQTDYARKHGQKGLDRLISRIRQFMYDVP
jgi:hypothetical protein